MPFNLKPLVTGILLVSAIAVSFLLPKPKYESLNILSNLNMPVEFAGWKSTDISKQLNIREGDLKDDRYNFVNDIFARVYKNNKGQELLLLILDAGNFHNPKVCYTSSGFAIRDMGEVNFQTNEKTFHATALQMSKQEYQMSLFYWLTIDKKIVNWTGQKITEFWSSLLNKKKAGLMVRLEIPSLKGREGDSLLLGRDFIQTLDQELNTEQKEYLFGRQSLPNNYTKVVGA